MHRTNKEYWKRVRRIYVQTYQCTAAKTTNSIHPAKENHILITDIPRTGLSACPGMFFRFFLKDISSQVISIFAIKLAQQLFFVS